MWYICRNNHIVKKLIKVDDDFVCPLCKTGVKKVQNLDKMVNYDGKIIKLRYVPNLYREVYKEDL